MIGLFRRNSRTIVAHFKDYLLLFIAIGVEPYPGVLLRRTDSLNGILQKIEQYLGNKIFPCQDLIFVLQKGQ